MRARSVVVACVVIAFYAHRARADEDDPHLEVGARAALRRTSLDVSQLASRAYGGSEFSVSEIMPFQLDVGARLTPGAYLGAYGSHAVTASSGTSPLDVTSLTRVGLQLRGIYTPITWLEFHAGVGLGVVIINAEHELPGEMASRTARFPGTEGTAELGAAWRAVSEKAGSFPSIGVYGGASAARLSTERIDGQSFDTAITALGWFVGLRIAYVIDLGPKSKNGSSK